MSTFRKCVSKYCPKDKRPKVYAKFRQENSKQFDVDPDKKENLLEAQKVSAEQAIKELAGHKEAIRKQVAAQLSGANKSPGASATALDNPANARTLPGDSSSDVGKDKPYEVIGLKEETLGGKSFYVKVGDRYVTGGSKGVGLGEKSQAQRFNTNVVSAESVYKMAMKMASQKSTSNPGKTDSGNIQRVAKPGTVDSGVAGRVAVKRSQSKPTTTKSSISELSPRQRRLLKKLERNGKVKVVTPKQAATLLGKDEGILRPDVNNKLTEGFYINGAIHLIPENIKSGQLWSTVKHEIGAHLSTMLEKDAPFQLLLSSLDARQNEQTATGKAIKKAMAMVPADTGLRDGDTYADLTPERKAQVDAIRREETLAYLLTGSPQVGIVRRFIAMVKRLLIKFGVDPAILTVEDLSGIAEVAIRREARGTVKDSLTVGIGEFAQSAKMSVKEAARKIQGVEAFKKWFDGSKIVDDNGEPLVVYHGTDFPGGFDVFSMRKEKNGQKTSYFTANADIASAYADRFGGSFQGVSSPQVLPVYLGIKNPLVFDAEGKGWGYANERALKLAKSGGNDGMIIKNVRDGASKETSFPSVVYVAFLPTQIKSIFNQGTWDGTNPNILKSEREAANPLSAKFKPWFGDSQVQSNGKPMVVYHGSRTFGKNDNFTFVNNTAAQANTKSPGAGLGHFFAESKLDSNAYAGPTGEVFPVYLRIENPLETNSFDMPNFASREAAQRYQNRLKRMGFDGIYLQDEGHWIAFDANQIKSADRNSGEYSRGNDDIRYSVSQVYDDLNPPPIGKTKAELEADRQAAYEANRQQNKDFYLTAIRNIRATAGKIFQGIDKYLGAVSTRLKNIHPKIEAKLRKLDFDTGTNLAKDIKAVQPLLKKAKKMSKEDFADWDFARKNSYVDKINELVKKYGMEKEYAAYRETLNNLRDSANHVGMDIAWIKDYAPRVIKDAQGFLNAVGKGDMRPAITDALKKRAEYLGISIADMSPEMKADIVSNMLFGGFSGIGKPSNTKERTLREIPPHLNKYYMDSDGALMYYLHSIRKNLEIRKFFGKTSTIIAAAKGSMHQAESRLRKAMAAEEEAYKAIHPDHVMGEPFPESDRITGIKETIAEYRSILDKYKNERGYSPFISDYVLELMSEGIVTPENEQDLVNIMQARFHERGTYGIVQAYKNLSYIDTIGSPFSAITQIGDLAWTIYENGWYRSIKGAYRSLARKSRITKEDVGIERIAQEFADSDTLSKSVAKVFKWTGLEKMDSVGKEAFLNAALEKFENEAQKKPEALKEKIKNIFEDETDKVIADLQGKKITDNVKLLVYSKLLDYQPAALSEMSEQYLKAGNGRIFYMLKSYTLKQFDVFRREVYNDMKKGTASEKLNAVKRLAYLSALIVLANAGADEVKDWMLGRETSLEDRTVDNVLKLFGVSKYITWQARTDGLGTAAAKQILPPFKFVNSLYKDIRTAGDEKGLDVVNSIPVVGKLAYWHMGRGQYNRKDLAEQRFSERRSKLVKIKEKADIDPALAMEKRKELSELRQMNRVQAMMNRQKEMINRLKKTEKRTGSDLSERINVLEQNRVKMAERYLAAVQ